MAVVSFLRGQPVSCARRRGLAVFWVVFVAGAAKTPYKAAPFLKGLGIATHCRLGGVGNQILACVALVLGLGNRGFVEAVLLRRGGSLL